jgi:hypothetical protein
MLSRILALLALSALPAGAEGRDPLKLAHVSARTYAAGLAAGDPLIVLTAAQLRLEAELAPGLPLTSERMLAQATELAGDDPALLALIDDVAATKDKGIASGPVYHLAAVPAGAADTRPPMPFRGGEYAEAYVEAVPGAILSLTILDAAGLVVCTDAGRSNIAYCGWTPATDGTFTLKIENTGTTPADYALMTN